MPSRLMTWAPVQDRTTGEWQPEWTCLRCSGCLTHQHPMLHPVPEAPCCAAHGPLRWPRTLALDVAHQERGWVCCQGHPPDILSCPGVQLPTPTSEQLPQPSQQVVPEPQQPTHPGPPEQQPQPQSSTLARPVKACRTAPSLNPNMKPQKNKARPKRPQFFLPGLLKVALLPGHWCTWSRRHIDPPKCRKARQCVSLRVNAVLGRARHACPHPKVRRPTVRRPKRPEATHESAEKLLSILAKPGIGQCSFRNETAGLGQG